MRKRIQRLGLIAGLTAAFALLVAAMGCGESQVAAPTVVPQPAAAPVPAIDPAALASVVHQAVGQAVQEAAASSATDVESAVAEAIANLPKGVSAAEMENAIRAAAADAPQGATAAQMEAAIRAAAAAQPSATEIQRMVETAVGAAVAPGATAAEVKALVDAAVAATSAQAATKEELEAAVAGAVAAEAAKGPAAVTAGDVEKIVAAALAAAAEEEAAGKPVGIQVGTTLSIPYEIANFYTLNPLLTDQSVAMKHTNVIEPLITFDRKTMVPRPRLAKSWEISADGLQYTFQLRDDAFWHDGEKFTSADVKFTIEAALLPTTKFRYLETWEKIKEVRTPDDYTVVLVLEEAFGPMLTALIGTGMIPKHLNEAYVDNMLEAPYSWIPVGTGPYKVTVHTDELVTWEANPNYWGEEARIEKVYWRDSPQGTTGQALLETGAADLAGFSADTMTELLKTGKYVVHKPISTTNTAVMHINHRDPLFEDKRVRQALMYAFDREAAIKAYGAPAMLMHSAVPPGTWAYNDKIKIYDYNPDKALELLAEVGWTKNADGKLVNAAGEPFKFTITHVPWGGLRESGVVAHQNWNDLGMEVDLKMTSDWSTWVENVRKAKQFQVGMMGHGLGIDPGVLLPTHYKCGSTHNLEGWCDAEVDGLMDEINTLSEPAARKPKFDRFQEIFVEEMPRLPVMHRLWETIADAKLKGIFIPAIPSAYFKMNEWYWEK